MVLLQALFVPADEHGKNHTPTQLEPGDIVDIREIPRIGNGFFITRLVSTVSENSETGFAYRSLWFETSDVTMFDELTEKSHSRRTPYCKIPDEKRVLEVLSFLVAGANLQMKPIKEGGGRYVLIKGKSAGRTTKSVPMAHAATATPPETPPLQAVG